MWVLQYIIICVSVPFLKAGSSILFHSSAYRRFLYEKAVKISPCPKMKNMTNWAHTNVSFDCHSNFNDRNISLLAVMSILRVLVLFYYIGMKTVKNLTGKKLKTRKFEMKNEKKMKKGSHFYRAFQIMPLNDSYISMNFIFFCIFYNPS